MTFLRPIIRSGTAKLNQYENDYKPFVDAIELNSRMIDHDEDDRILLIIEKYLIFSLSILYAGICPLATVVCFGFYIIDAIIERYIFCYVCKRETPIVDARSFIWTSFAEIIIVANVISNSLLLYVATISYDTMFITWFKVKDSEILWYVLLIEHIVIAIQIGIKFVIPDMPKQLQKLVMRHILELEHFFAIKSSELPTALEKRKGVE